MPFVGDRRIVVEVDQIMRHAGMMRLALGDLFEDRRALELVGVGLVGRRRRGVERERIVDLRFVVVRITLRPAAPWPWRRPAGACGDRPCRSRRTWRRAPRCSRARARSWRRCSCAFRQRGSALGEVLRRRRGMGIPQQAERNAPIGDGAFGIGLQHLLEGLLRSAVPRNQRRATGERRAPSFS